MSTWSPRPARRSRDRGQDSFLRARKSRWERYVRAGAGYVASANLIEGPGTALVAPIAAGDELARAVVSFSLEFFGTTDYPEGDLLDTGEFVVALTAPGILTLTKNAPPNITITVDLADITIVGGGVPPSGVHFISVFFDPPNNRAGLYLDGDQIGQDTGAFADWSSGTWEYLQGVTDLGTPGNLEVYPGFLPPTFIG